MATLVAQDNLLQDAALIVDVCFSVEEGDVVTIICDDDREDEARAVAEVCVDRGAWPVIMNNETQVRRGRADVRFPMAPPANLHRAMVGSDEVIIIANLEWANRFAHVNAVRETCEANGKIASIEPGMGAWGLTQEDLERSAQRVAVEARPDLARVVQAVRVVDADEQRAELDPRALGRREAADHELLAVLALELQPVARARRGIRCLGTLGDDALPALFAGLREHLDALFIAMRAQTQSSVPLQQAAQQTLPGS